LSITDINCVQSEQQGNHCPFLNRADVRCGENFSLERLDHAYQYCFDRYQTCAIYHELLVERRVRRISANATPNATRARFVTQNLVQVTVHRTAA
jgi:hypothetical protein